MEYVRPQATKILVERDEAGRERKVVATNGGTHQPDFWKIELQHPDGGKFSDRINGNHTTVIAKMEQMLAERRRDFVQAGQRGDRPRQKMQFDRNVPVSDLDPQAVYGYTKR
jgi:hypothetical protein